MENRISLIKIIAAVIILAANLANAQQQYTYDFLNLNKSVSSCLVPDCLHFHKTSYLDSNAS